MGRALVFISLLVLRAQKDTSRRNLQLEPHATYSVSAHRIASVSTATDLRKRPDMQQWKTILMRLLPAAVMGLAVIVARGIVPTVSAQQIAAGAAPGVFAIGLVVSPSFRR